MTVAGGSPENPSSVDHLIELGYRDPLDETARQADELRAEAEQLKQAQEWLKAGKTTLAIELLEQVASAAADRAAPRRLLAHAYLHADQLNQASQTLRSLELDGVEEAELALLRATIASRQRRFDEAIEYAQYALCLRQPLPAAELILGESYRTKGDLTGAEAAFQRAAEHESTRAAACLGLAAVSQRRGDHRQAVELLLTALDIDMSVGAAHYRLGLSLVQLGRSHEAQVALETCLKLQPGLCGPWRLLAQLSANRGDTLAAEQDRERGRLAVRERRLARSQVPRS